MIRSGFLDSKLRQELIALAQNGSAAHRLARRANALVLLDDGMSCEAIAKVLLLDDDTIRTWYRLYEKDGMEGLDKLRPRGRRLPVDRRATRKVESLCQRGASALEPGSRRLDQEDIRARFPKRSGLIALLHRLGLQDHKPNDIPSKLNKSKQKAFIEGYEKLLNSLGDDEAVLLADAVIRPCGAAGGCWAPREVAIEQTSGRERINIHGAIDLETGQTH